MRNDGQHAARVDDWLAKAVASPSPNVLLRPFEAPPGALWSHAAVTLGGVALAAIAERVLQDFSLTAHVTELGLSPIADNLIMLRYSQAGGQLTPTLTIVNTRGSDHDHRTHAITVAKGGMRIGNGAHGPVVLPRKKRPPVGENRKSR